MTVITRFAPSPTGFLHIGNARTGLFSWLYARHMGGKFLLRIEDTDRKRSTDEAIDAIFQGLDWLGLDWDEEPVFQFANSPRHQEVAEQLLQAGRAYRCYCSPEELQEMRDKARAEKQPVRYDGRWRDRDPSEAPAGVDPVIRFKAPQSGETIIKDHVQGDVTVANPQLDDMILLRSDGTPTYMLSVVVDDHDMAITHVVRGDDHLTNAARQSQLFLAMDWDVPEYAHVPMIHGPDGGKLSKRHGALGVGAYEDLGYLPEAMVNYLSRLGWGHGDDEVFTMDQAIEWFDLKDIGKAPARLDFAKLENLNGIYIREAKDKRLSDMVAARLANDTSRPLTDDEQVMLLTAMPELKMRVKTIVELADLSRYCMHIRPLVLDAKAAKQIEGQATFLLGELHDRLAALNDWSGSQLELEVREFAENAGVKLGKVAQPLRAALTGRTISPGIFDVLVTLGREESLGRISDVLTSDRGEQPS